jgi:uncharacterized protein YndB with AHSA1/START domain
MEEKHMPANEKNVQGHEQDREIVSTRIFDAPRDLVWQAWSEPQHLRHWWGPKDFRNTFETFDFQPNGVWRFIMHGPDGTDYPQEWVFVEIVKPSLIVLDHLNAPKFRVTATFEAVDGKTKVTFRQLFESAAICDSVKPRAVPGNEQNFDRLAAQLSIMQGDARELTITRTFDAPRALVWKAWTDPVHLAAWWGPAGFTNPVCKIDVRPGGAILIVMRAPDGAEYPMRGIFQEIVEPERIVFSNFAVDDKDNPITDGLTTVTFTERDGKTEMVLHTRVTALVPQAIPMIAGTEAGCTQGLERLANMLATL